MYQVIFTNGTEDYFEADSDQEAIGIAQNYFADRWNGDFYTEPLIPHSIYRQDDFGDFTNKIY